MSPEQAVYLAEQLGVNPVTAVVDQYRRDGGYNTRLNRVLSDMRYNRDTSHRMLPCLLYTTLTRLYLYYRRNPHQSSDKSQVYYLF